MAQHRASQGSKVQTAAQRRCGERGHWQAMLVETGEAISADCVYCGYVADTALLRAQGRAKVPLFAAVRVDSYTRGAVLVCAVSLSLYVLIGLGVL